MSLEAPKLNQVGLPPPGRTIHRRRADMEAEAEAAGDGEGFAASWNPILLSALACGAVVAVGLALAWLVL